MTDISIIVVNHNSRAHLDKCLSSLEGRLTQQDCELLVVDNNSSDGSQDMVERRFPQVQLISNQDNLGFARANNQAVRQSLANYYLFLNPDTLLSTEALDLMLEEMRKNTRVGAIGPALLDRESRYQVSFGRRVDFGAELLQKCFFNPYHRARLKHDPDTRDVGWLSGACLLVRRDVLIEVGAFDENFFLYFEDIDLCLRIKQKGYRLVYLPQAKVYHEGGASTSLDETSSRFEYRKSQLYFYQKHNSRVSLRLLRLYLFLKFSLGSLFGKRSKREEYRKTFWLLRDYRRRETNR